MVTRESRSNPLTLALSEKVSHKWLRSFFKNYVTAFFILRVNLGCFTKNWQVLAYIKSFKMFNLLQFFSCISEDKIETKLHTNYTTTEGI